MRRAWLLALGLALMACSEEPQRLDGAERPGYASDAWPEQLRERTLRQNESGRIY
ncbi:MAG TPA: hypothetical protein VHG88_06670 [Burkholderiales bacterium]|nr:hypothetical protein [Burkholderiales bacterium]